MSDELPDDLLAYRESYLTMFGEVPPLPAAKFEVTGRLDPEVVRLGEALRAHAFLGDTLDPLTTQLLLFAMLLIGGSGAARHHAGAARRVGASDAQLQAVINLASAVASLGPANNGAQILRDLESEAE